MFSVVPWAKQGLPCVYHCTEVCFRFEVLGKDNFLYVFSFKGETCLHAVLHVQVSSTRF